MALKGEAKNQLQVFARLTYVREFGRGRRE